MKNADGRSAGIFIDSATDALRQFPLAKPALLLYNSA